MASPRFSSRPGAPAEGQQPPSFEHEVFVEGGQKDRHQADTARDRLIALVTPELVRAVQDLYPRIHYSPMDTMEFIHHHEGQQRVVATLLEALRERRT